MSSDILCALSAALMHELGHIAAMRALGVKPRRFRFSLAGAVIEGDRMSNVRLGRVSRVEILLAGAQANLLGWGLGRLIGGEFCELFGLCSLVLAAVNLLPIRSLDGGEALRVIFGDSRVLRAISLASLVCVWLLSVAAVFLSGNLSLCLLAAEVFVSVYLRGGK